MSEIKKYSLEVNTGWDDQVEVRTFVLARDHKQALAQAKREGVREFLERVKTTDLDTYHQGEAIFAIGKIRSILRGENISIEEIIKKVEGL